MSLFLIKVGEIKLKKGNRSRFEGILQNNISLKCRLQGIKTKLSLYPGRWLMGVEDKDDGVAATILETTPGVNGFAPVLRVDKNIETVCAAATSLAGIALAAGAKSFKAESRRSDKSYPLDSYEISARVGTAIQQQFPEARVELRSPQFVINIEIRDQAYIFSSTEPGLAGLPIKSQGRGLALLSGGIDSPVAAFLMFGRGLDLEFCHFESSPYTSPEAQDKVLRLCEKLLTYPGRLRLHLLPFAKIQDRLRAEGPESCLTLFSRMLMVQIANRLAEQRHATCLVTGDSLGQVASQTTENLGLIDSQSKLPLFRPLIGMDKEATIKIAKKIGCYEISILDYPDCCALFSPSHPILRPTMAEGLAAFSRLHFEDLIEDSLERRQTMEMELGTRQGVPLPS